MPDDAADLLSRATALRADAVGHLTLLAGDASMCAIGRSGRSFPAAKYHEGRQAAAGQVRRALRADASAGTAVLERLRAEWEQTLAHAESKGRDWVAYATGGLDALGELAELAAPAAPMVLGPSAVAAPSPSAAPAPPPPSPSQPPSPLRPNH